ncbi:MAG: hypothetical protein H8E57_02910 [Candidatus Cloacimonetes bacterium]|nr:hypothetical protein [Candidatus Cloacimonadota bacterium]
MDAPRFNDLLDVLLADKPAKAKLKRLGMTEDDLKKFIDDILKDNKEKHYNRILSKEEKRVMTPKSYGYLIDLLRLNSIDNELFERIITLSMQLNIFMKKKINKNMMEEIVNYLMFTEPKEVSIKELLDIFYVYENEIVYPEVKN